MITDRDITKLKTVFVTREEFQSSVSQLTEYINIRAGQMEERFSVLEDKMAGFVDQIIAEIIKMREDITITVGYRDAIEEHGVRITALESKTSAKN